MKAVWDDDSYEVRLENNSNSSARCVTSEQTEGVAFREDYHQSIGIQNREKEMKPRHCLKDGNAVRATKFNCV